MDYDNLPENWPEMYNRAGLGPCPHQMHWDDETEKYICLNNCGHEEDEPPVNKLLNHDDS